jgi:curli biogenesis system outer membrane secretion channel CsgG
MTSRNVSHWAVCALLASAGACAVSSVQQRAAAIADSDREAKRAVATEARIDPGKIPARSISVLPFTVAGSDTSMRPLAFAMSDFLVSDLSRSPQLQLLERQRIDAILRELDLVDRGAADPRTAPRVGRLIGARRVVIGEMASAPGGTIVISLRVVDVIAGTVAQVITASAPLARTIDAEKSLAIRVFEQLGITLTPSQRALVEQRPTTNLDATVAYGRGVEAEARGDAIGAVGAFGDAARLDAGFAAARAQIASNGPSSNGRAGSGLARVLDLSAQAINAPAATRIADAADLPFQSSQLYALLLTVRIF